MRLFSPITLVVIFLLFQISALVLSFLFISSFPIITTVLDVLVIIVALIIVNSKSGSSYKISWFFLIVILPFFGTVLYLLFGNKKFTKRQTQKITPKIKFLYDLSNKTEFEDIKTQNLEILQSIKDIESELIDASASNDIPLLIEQNQTLINKIKEIEDHMMQVSKIAEEKGLNSRKTSLSEEISNFESKYYEKEVEDMCRKNILEINKMAETKAELEEVIEGLQDRRSHALLHAGHQLAVDTGQQDADDNTEQSAGEYQHMERSH